MPTVRTEIEIDASPEVVWQVLTDLGTYADWNPVVMAPRCRGPLGPGADFDFRLKEEGVACVCGNGGDGCGRCG